MNKLILFLILEGILTKVKNYIVEHLKYSYPNMSLKNRVDAAKYVLADLQFDDEAFYNMFPFLSLKEGHEYWENIAEKWRFFKLNYDPTKEAFYRFLVYHGILMKWVKHFNPNLPLNERVAMIKQFPFRKSTFGGEFVVPRDWHTKGFYIKYRDLWHQYYERTKNAQMSEQGFQVKEK